MNINLEGRMYRIGNDVYIGYTAIRVHNQKGKLFVNYKGKQRNLKNIPALPPALPDPVFDYVFGGGFQTHPCPAMDYWITKYRMKRKITIEEFKRTASSLRRFT